MANKPTEQKKTEEKSQGLSRRQLLFGGGGTVAGLAVGGAIGYGVIPPRKLPLLAEPDTWIGRNVESCTGCRLCQIACSQVKEQKIQPGISRMTIHQYYPGIEFPVACYQCGDFAKCIEACPTAALTVDNSKNLNTIKIDLALCTRTARDSDCTLCLDECPGQAVTFHPTTKEPLICDMCDGDPECVKVCPAKTLTLKGLKIATVSPAEIAAGMAVAYEVPESYKKLSGTGGLGPAPKKAPSA